VIFAAAKHSASFQTLFLLIFFLLLPLLPLLAAAAVVSLLRGQLVKPAACTCQGLVTL